MIATSPKRTAAIAGCMLAAACSGGQHPAQPEPASVATVQPAPPAEHATSRPHASPPQAAATPDETRRQRIQEALANLAQIPELDADSSTLSGSVIRDVPVPDGSLDEASAPAAGLPAPVADLGGTRAPAVTATATVGPVTVNGGTMPGAQSRAESLEDAFRSCYQQSLQANPAQQASLVVEIDVDASGQITSARTAVRQGVDYDVAICVESQARSARFERPSGAVTLAFQVTFRHR